MKNFQFSIAFFLLVSLSSTSFAQGPFCDGGGCSNLDYNYPSGTFSTTSSSWQTVSSYSWGGDYATFSVTAGNTYEWSTCNNFGGSQAWDAQLTLYSSSNSILCFNDDCGRPSCPYASYLGWTATYSGTVKLLLSEYYCLTSDSGFTTIVWRQSATGSTCTPPAAPFVTAVPHATNPSTSITISWNAISGAVDYDVYDCSDDSYLGYVTGTSADITGLSPGTSYSFKVTACATPTCCSGPSNCAQATTQGNNVVYCNPSSTLTASSGSLDDGSGSNNYGNNSSCNWLIQPTGASTVTLTFASYDVEDGYDFLTVYDGTSSSATVLATLTGTTLPIPITSTGGSMFVSFTSDNTVTAAGWAANYNSTTGGQTYCSGTTNLTTVSGNFDDGSGASDYGNNSDCKWLIQPSGATDVTLTFSAFDVESGYDYVTVYDGTSTASTVLGNFTGSTIPNSVTSSGGAILVHFTSDNIVTASGFAAAYTSNTGGGQVFCSGSTTLTASSGTIDDGSAASDYGHNSNCQWLIQPSSASSITLNFTSFNTESGYDFVKVYDGSSTLDPLLGSFSGTSLPPSVTSTGGSMLNHFTSDNIVTAAGWLASYTSTTGGNPSPVANFSANSTNVQTGQSVDFTDLSSNTPTSWSWTFQGANTSSSALQNPSGISWAAAGCYEVTLTATNSNGSDTEVKACYINVGQPTTNQVQVGGLIVKASNIIANGHLHTCTGSISIVPASPPGCAEVLKFTGTVTVNTSTNQIASTGLVFLYGILGQNQNLFNSALTFSVSGTKMTATFNSTYNIALLQLTVNHINVLCDGVRLEGKVHFPSQLTFQNGAQVDPYLTQIQITQSNGLQIVGGINLSNLRVNNSLMLNYLNVSFNSITNVFSGGTGITTPLFGVSANATIANGGLENISASYTPTPPIPLASTGLAFATFSGGVQYIQTPPPLRIDFSTRIVPAPGVNLSSFGHADVAAYYQLGTVFGASGKVKLFGTDFFNASFNAYQHKFDFASTLSFFNTISGYANLTIDHPPLLPTTLHGGFGATLKVPNITSPQFLVWTMNFVGLSPGNVLGTSQNYVNNNYLAGFGELNFFVLPRLYYLFNWSGGSFSPSFGTNYSLLPVAARNYLGVRQRSLNPFSEVLTFTVNYATNSAVVEAWGDGNLPDYVIVTPTGDTLTTNNHTLFDDVFYGADPANEYSFFHISNPEVGEYIVGVYVVDSIQIYGANMPPSIQINSVTDNSGSKELVVAWMDADPDDDADITFGLDQDNEGANGLTLATGYTENDNTDQATISYTDYPTGEYFVYALITDSLKQTSHDYYDQPVKLITNNAPLTPINLNYQLTDTSIIINFTDPNTIPVNFMLYYENESGGLSFQSENINIGNQTTYEFRHFNPGSYFEMMVTALDTFNRESDHSNIISFTWTSGQLVNSAYFDEQQWPFILNSGQPLIYPVQMINVDNVPISWQLLDGPNNLQITQQGDINWLPLSQHLGYHTVKIGFTDGTGRSDSTLFPLLVLNNEMKEAKVEFNKALYVDFTDEIMVTVTDLNHQQSDGTDSVQVRIYSDTDLNGIVVKAYETEPNSRTFKASAMITSSTSGNGALQTTHGDELWAEYVDINPTTLVKNYSRFVEFDAMFSFVDSVCAGDSVQFENQSSGQGLNFSWQFGNGSLSDDRNPTTAFNPIPGIGYQTYYVTLTLSDDEGRNDTYTQPIHIARAPIAAVILDSTVCEMAYLSVASTPIVSTLWSTGETFTQIVAAENIAYHVTVTGANGCQAMASYTVAGLEPVAFYTASNDPACAGNADGSIFLNTQGGTSPYTFNWSNGNTLGHAIGLTSGFYRISATDANGCVRATEVLLTDPTPVSIGIQLTNSSIGNNDGEIDATGQGGMPPYTYAWSHGANTASVTNLAAGNYTVTLTDANGCSSTVTTTVSEECLVVEQVSTTHITPNSARLNWQIANGSMGYQIRGKALNVSTWTVIDVNSGNSDSKNVYGLPSGQTFMWQIRNNCVNSRVSEWSVTDTFTTACQVTTNHWTDPVSVNAATLHWETVPGAAGYQIRGRNVNSSNWANIMVGPSNSSKNVFGLAPSTTYEWAVRTWCNQSGSEISAYTEYIQFTTSSGSRLAGVSDPFSPSTENLEVHIYPNPFKHQTVVELLNDDKTVLEIQITDLSGKGYRKYERPEGNTFIIERGDLAAGMYFIKLRTADEVVVKKIWIH